MRFCVPIIISYSQLIRALYSHHRGYKYNGVAFHNLPRAIPGMVAANRREGLSKLTSRRTFSPCKLQQRFLLHTLPNNF